MNITEQNALLLLEFIPYSYLMDCKGLGIINDDDFETIKRVEKTVCNENGVNIRDAQDYKSAKIRLIGELVKQAKELRDIKVEQRKNSNIQAIKYGYKPT